MSEAGDNRHRPEEGARADQDGTPHEPAAPSCNARSSSDVGSLLPAELSTVPCDGASPSPEQSGLLSLPWEMVTHIASHLSAQCVISVLPKVCHALGNVGKDNTAWKLRARRLTGSKATYPIGPSEDFDWALACLEMEQLITRWTDQAHLVAQQNQQDEQDREQVGQRQRAGQDEGAVAEGLDGEREEEIEGVGVAAREVVYGADEGLEVAAEAEDADVQPIGDADQIMGAREELGDRLGNHAAVPIDVDAGELAGHNHRAHLANGIQVQVEQPQLAQNPTSPPALECITLPSQHVAQVNTVLLLGGEGKACATGSRDYNVKLWDLQKGPEVTLLHTLVGRSAFSTHQGWVWCMASQGQLLASGSFDSTVKLWDLQACGAERGLINAGGAVHCMSFQPDVLLTSTWDKRISMYDIRAAQPLVKSLRFHENVMCLAADDKYIIYGSKDRTVAVHDRRAGKNLKRIQLNSYLLCMSYSDCEVWAGDITGKLHSFSMRDGTLKAMSQIDVGHTALITGIHRSPGGLYTCSSDRTVKVHIPCGPPRTLCTLQHHVAVLGLSVEAGVLAVAVGEYSHIWRPRE